MKRIHFIALVAVLSAELLKVQAGTEVELPPIYEFISAWTLIESPDTKEYSGELRGLGAVYNGKHDDLSKSYKLGDLVDATTRVDHGVFKCRLRARTSGCFGRRHVRGLSRRADADAGPTQCPHGQDDRRPHAPHGCHAFVYGRSGRVLTRP